MVYFIVPVLANWITWLAGIIHGFINGGLSLFQLIFFFSSYIGYLVFFFQTKFGRIKYYVAIVLIMLLKMKKLLNAMRIMVFIKLGNITLFL